MQRIQKLALPLVLVAIAFYSSTPLTSAQETAAPSTDVANSEVEVSDQAPHPAESALRKFLISMISGDARALKEVTVPNDEIGILLGGQRPPKAALEQIKQSFKKMPIKRLTIGDNVKLPTGKTIVMNKSHINERRQMLTFPNNPIPFDVVRVEEQWKINPKPIIAARKAAASARSERTQQQPKTPNK